MTTAPMSRPPAGPQGAVLLALSAVDAVATGVILPALPFFALDMGAGPVAVGALFAASAVTQLLLAPMWGGLADRIGTRRLLMVAPLVAAAGHLTLALSQDYPTMFVARVLAGTGGAVPVLLQTHMVGRIAGDARTVMIGRLTAVQGAGTIVGPALGALAVPYGIGPVGTVAAAAAFAAAVLATRVSTGEPAAGTVRKPVLGAIGSLLRSRRLRPLAAIAFVGWFGFTGYATVLPLFLHEEFRISSTAYGGLMAISGIVALLVRGLLLSRLVSRFGEPGLMVAGALLLATSMALVPLLPTVWWTPLLPLTYAIGAGLLFPCQVTRMSRSAPNGAAGLALGGNATVGGIGTVLGPLAVGGLFVSLSGGLFALGAVLFTVVAMIALVTQFIPTRKAHVAP
ncbi:MFS transporter [Streptosporangium sp. CA-115845]|uniref:MFS transporter n=1 Tax=Streptosporangium sp. CA-115845 TaxID=3240071 RepID=UPI003D8EF447